MNEKCPVCNLDLLKPSANAGGDATTFVCPRCGTYTLTGSLLESLPHLLSTDTDASAKLSHALRRAQENGELPKFSTHTADAVLKHRLPRPREQADLLLRWLAKHLPGPGETLWLEPNTHGAIIGSKSA